MTMLVLIEGDDEEREYEYNAADGSSIDLTGCTIDSEIEFYNGTMALSAVIYTAPVNGLIRVLVTSAQTTELRSKFERGAQWHLAVTGPATGGKRKTIVQGIVSFREE